MVLALNLIIKYVNISYILFSFGQIIIILSSVEYYNSVHWIPFPFFFSTGFKFFDCTLKVKPLFSFNNIWIVNLDSFKFDLEANSRAVEHIFFFLFLKPMIKILVQCWTFCIIYMSVITRTNWIICNTINTWIRLSGKWL